MYVVGNEVEERWIDLGVGCPLVMLQARGFSPIMYALSILFILWISRVRPHGWFVFFSISLWCTRAICTRPTRTGVRRWVAGINSWQFDMLWDSSYKRGDFSPVESWNDKKYTIFCFLYSRPPVLYPERLYWVFAYISRYMCVVLFHERRRFKAKGWVDSHPFILDIMLVLFLLHPDARVFFGSRSPSHPAI